VSRLAVHFGRTPWGGLLIAASPGLLYAASVSTTECVAAALISLTLLAWVRGRIGLAGIGLVLMCLTKEQYVVVPIGLAVWEYVRARRVGAWPDRIGDRAFVLAAGPLALAAWYLWVHTRLGVWPSSYEDGNIGAPFVGWIETFRRATDLAAGDFWQSQIGTTSTPLLIATAVVLVAAFVRSLRLRTPLDAIVLGLVAITACMGYLTLLLPHELVRNPSITLLLAISALLVRPREEDLHPASPEPEPDRPTEEPAAPTRAT
jgi:hypothetical protein